MSKRLTLIDVWAIALTDDVELRGRLVFRRYAEHDEDEPMKLAGELDPNVREDDFYREVAEAYSK